MIPAILKQYENIVHTYTIVYCPDCDAKRFANSDNQCEVCGSGDIVETISDYEEDRD